MDLFDKVVLHNMVCKNHFIRSATNDFMGNLDGSLSKKEIELYEELAKGNVGLIMTANYAISAEGRNDNHMSVLGSEYDLEPTREMIQVVHSYGSKVVAQISHCGMNSKISEAVKAKYSDLSKVSLETIENLIFQYGEAAYLAKQAGFDGVQVHCAHAYQHACFLDPYYNNRTDYYGGNKEKRPHFLVECLKKIRERCGEDYPIFIKVNCNSLQLSFDEYKESFVELLNQIKEFRISLIEISGYEFKTYGAKNHNYYLEYAKELLKFTEIPMAIVGGTRSLEDMEEALKAGMKMISLCRPLIRNSNFLNELKENGKMSTCITCGKCFTLPLETGKRCIFD